MIKDLSESITRGRRDDDWAIAHRAACQRPHPGHEAGLVLMAAGITFYAREMVAGRDTDERETVFDGVLSPALGEMLSGFRTLLNGERGRLDGGTCDTWALETAKAVEWDLETDAPTADPEPETYRIVRRYENDDFADQQQDRHRPGGRGAYAAARSVVRRLRG
jgi:hypothetical protein